MSATTASTNPPAAQAAPQNENLPSAAVPKRDNLPSAAPYEQFTLSTMEDISGAVSSTKGRDINKAAVSSVNMVSDYLGFDDLINKPIRRFFCGWTARPLVDFNTKEPQCDPETGEQLYGPAAILYDQETEKMQVSMAAILVGTIKERKFKPGQGLQITCKGYKKTGKGNKAQDFDIRTLEEA